MSLEYTLSTRESGTPELSCKNANAIVKSLGIQSFGDCITFEKKNSDGSTFGSDWGLHNLGCFSEMKSYERIMHMPKAAVKQLAARIYQTLYTRACINDAYYKNAPEVKNNEVEFRQILEQLLNLQSTEKKLIKSGVIFP
jgi:hypothetical protein